MVPLVLPFTAIPLALESERARVNIPNVLDEVRKSGKTSLNKDIPMTEEDKKVLNSSKFKKASEATKDMKKGGMVKSSASSRADGCATKGKTKGTMISMKSGGAC